MRGSKKNIIKRLDFMQPIFNKRLLAYFILCIILLGSLLFIHYQNSGKLAQANKMVGHSNEVLFELGKIHSYVDEMEATTRGYLTTGDPIFSSSSNDAQRSIYEHVDKLIALTTDYPLQQKKAVAIKKQLGDLVQYNRDLFQDRSANSREAGKKIPLEENKLLYDQLRKAINEAISAEDILLSQRQHESEALSTRNSMLFVGLIFIACILLVIAYFIILSNQRALKNAEADSFGKNWILSGNIKLNEKIRGEKSLTDLAQTIIDQLCSYTNAQIGVIYLYENNQLELISSYAFQIRKENHNIIKIGEGLVGQAAQEKKTIVFTEVPSDYLKINSGLGDTLPRNIIILPLLQDGLLRGVVEIGSAHVLSDLKIQFLNAIAESIAISLGSAMNREMLKTSMLQIQDQKTNIEKVSLELNQQVACLNKAAIVSIADANGDIIYVNEKFCEISKYNKEELLGRNHRLLKSGKQPDGLFVGMWKAISSGRI